MRKFELASQSAVNALVSLLGRAPNFNNKRAGHRTFKWYVHREHFKKIRALCKAEGVLSGAYTLDDNTGKLYCSRSSFTLRVPLDCKRPDALCKVGKMAFDVDKIKFADLRTRQLVQLVVGATHELASRV